MSLHATWFEWTFVLIGVVAIVTSVTTWHDAVSDSQFLMASGKNGLRKMVADQNVRQESYRLAAATVMLMVGIAFLFLSPPPPDYYDMPQAAVGLLGWMLLAGTLVLNSLMDRSIRHRFSRIYDSPNPTDPQTGQSANQDAPPDDDPSHTGSYGDDVRGLNKAAEPVHVVVDNTPLAITDVPHEEPGKDEPVDD